MKGDPAQSGDDRLLAFEVGTSAYALPIESVVEVAEADRVTCVPGMPADVAGVMNWHGDPLTLISSQLLLASAEGGKDEVTSGEEDSSVAAEGILRAQVLVLSDRADEPARLGMPVDRVLGLVPGGSRPGRAQSVVVERRPVDGRVVSVLDPQGLVARAVEVIERAVGEAAA
ncbi:MAG: chemotaxis protein CheW [Deltaproteobacteria bacterium]|nr:chemotaxis protein CheW [Deltaproteobacteria bacterium]MBW2384446.1 chemotaxis protein CheW [Deltaproteobacteria bacterium]MBW2695188.1 chemotaxis protein CheW [Deltaproteobacteria bacterium]